MINYKIVIPGEPIAKARPRFAHKDKNGKALPFVRTYSTQKDQEAAYRWQIIKYLTKSGIGLFIIEDGPIAIGLTYIMPIRKNWPQYKIRDMERGMTFYHHIKPDISNLIKFTEDVLEGLCYKNDSQIAILDPPPIKIYGIAPQTIIRIRTLPAFEVLENKGSNMPLKSCQESEV